MFSFPKSATALLAIATLAGCASLSPDGNQADINTLTAGNLRVDDVSVVLMPDGTIPRADGIETRSADGLLPPPAAPDNFRGNN